MKKITCPKCGNALKIEYGRPKVLQAAGFVHCPSCGETLEGNERPSFISITVSLADMPEVQVDENLFFGRERQRR